MGNGESMRNRGHLKIFFFSCLFTLAACLFVSPEVQAQPDLKICNELQDPNDPSYPDVCRGQGRLDNDAVTNVQNKATTLGNTGAVAGNSCQGQECFQTAGGNFFYDSSNAARAQAIENLLNSDKLTEDAQNYLNMGMLYIQRLDAAENAIDADPTIEDDDYALPGLPVAAIAPRTGGANDQIFMREVFDSLGPGFLNGTTYGNFTAFKANHLISLAMDLAAASVQAAQDFTELADKNNESADDIDDLRRQTGDNANRLQDLANAASDPLNDSTQNQSEESNLGVEPADRDSGSENLSLGSSTVDFNEVGANGGVGGNGVFGIGKTGQPGGFTAETTPDANDFESTQGSDGNGSEVEGLIADSNTKISDLESKIEASGIRQRLNSDLKIDLEGLSSEDKARVSSLEGKLQEAVARRKAEMQAKYSKAASAGASRLSGVAVNSSKSRRALNEEKNKRLADLRKRAEALRKKLLENGGKKLDGKLAKSSLGVNNLRGTASGTAPSEDVLTVNVSTEYASPFDKSLFERISTRIENYERKRSVGMNYLID